MQIMIAILANFALPLLLIAGAYCIGKIIEMAHFRSIQRREAACEHRPTLTAREWDNAFEVEYAELTTGSVVVSVDYFKRFVAGLYNLVGGRVRSYESVLDRGRREAILRMKESRPDADLFVNMRLETSILASTTPKGQYLGGMEVISYGTAISYRKGNAHEIRAEITGGSG